MPPLAFAPAGVRVERRADGATVLRSIHPLPAYPRHVSERLRHWADAAPARTFLAERAADGGWRRVTYSEARAAVDALAQALLDRGLDADRPVMVLSENGVDHALLALGAMQAGVPVTPVSTAYSLASRDHARLRAIHALLAPGLVYAHDGARYAAALAALAVPPARVVTSVRPPAGAATLDALLATRPTPAMASRYAALGPDAVAKVLFTSGSTGEPKGVINTQRMLCSNQTAIATLWPFLTARPPVVLDWLPWSHTFGGNHNFNMVLFHGGALYVDDGRPTPDGIARTLSALRDVSPTLYFNVPRGFDALAPHLERDPALRDALFRDLDALFYAAASLPHPLWERYEALSLAARGGLVAMLSAWGSTETAPLATGVHFPIRRAGVIGLPAPGTEIKLAPVEARLELRVRGPNVTPGYWRRPDLLAAALDDEGFLRMGDAGRLADPAAPEQGLVFDGRLAEDFKLASGTWVHVGPLRTALVARLAPLCLDAVLAGLDRDEVGALVFVNPAAARALCPDLPPDAPLAAVCAHGAVRDRLRADLAAHAAENPPSSRRVGRALLMAEPASIDAGEVTDKGYTNQRAVLARRAALVERMYRAEGDDVVVLA